MDKLATIPMDYLIAALAVLFTLGLIAFVIAAGVLAGALKNIKSLFDQKVETTQVGPQPFVVREQVSFATEAELKRVEGKVDKLEGSLTSLGNSIVTNGEKRKTDIQHEVKEARDEAQANFATLNREMGGVKAALELLAKQVEKVSDKQSR